MNSYPATGRTILAAVVWIVPVQVGLPIVAVEVGVRHIAGSFATLSIHKDNFSRSQNVRIGLLVSSPLDGDKQGSFARVYVFGLNLPRQFLP